MRFHYPMSVRSRDAAGVVVLLDRRIHFNHLAARRLDPQDFLRAAIRLQLFVEDAELRRRNGITLGTATANHATTVNAFIELCI